MFRSASCKFFALVIAIVLIQLVVVWSVLNYEPTLPVPANLNLSRSSMPENALPVARSGELTLADTSNDVEPSVQPFPEASEAPPSAAIEHDVEPVSDLSFQAEAIIWESEKDYNLESGIAPEEVEYFADVAPAPVEYTASVADISNAASENHFAFQRAATVLDAAVASGRWSHDDFSAVVTEMQQLNMSQRQGLALRFHAALGERRLSAAAIADVGVPMPF